MKGTGNIHQVKYKYVFVCGLPRSGTSVLARNITRFEDCTGFENTGVSQDEGQYLQDVYPAGFNYGGPGRTGFDPRAHLTEESPLLTPGNIARLRACWHAYWDSRKTICMEKTPWNLLMTRFLQAVFPDSYFIVIKRHPIPVSLGTQRLWNTRPTSLHQLFEHWLHCHRIFDEDKKRLRSVYELTYEDYIANPARIHQEIAAFIGTRVSEATTEEVSSTQSNKYFDLWSRLLTHSRFKSHYRYLAAKYEPKFASYGYSLTKISPGSKALCEESEVSPVIGAFSCAVVDSYSFLRRAATWPALYLKRQAKAHLPQPIVAKIKAARQRNSAPKQRPRALAR